MPRGVCWGHSSYGGNCGSVNFNSVSFISSNRFAYAAYSASEGSMQCWGSSSYGGLCSQALWLEDFTSRLLRTS